MLEVELRKFSCLSKNDAIAVKVILGTTFVTYFSIQYNNQVLEFTVMDVQPGDAVSIIECDGMSMANGRLKYFILFSQSGVRCAR